jgi:tight adherence protein C
MNDQLLFTFCLFGLVSLAVYGLSRLFNRAETQRVHERLTSVAPQEKAAPSTAKIKEFFQRIGHAAAKPFMPETREKQSALRRKLGLAGIYSASAVRMVVGCKVILLVAGLAVGYAISLVSQNLLLSTALGALAGYLLPSFWLRWRISKQQKSLEYALPDALDLMVVCVEAGLAIDAAMQRVGTDLSLVHPSLSRELEISHMETRVGLSRAESLRNLGLRTGSPALQGLASMLIQAERFGTSIASALRVHGESLRVARQNKAEEMAAKATVKMSFPLVLFIFPATFIVLAGPTIIGIMNSSLFK